MRTIGFLRLFGLGVMLGAVALSNVKAEDLPRITVAALKYGTVNWELQVMKAYGLDRQHSFELRIREVNSPAAASVALQAGAADVAVQDWLWVLRQQEQGRSFRFHPYSVAVGRLMVPTTSGMTTLEQLRGATIGVAGGDSDKGWQLLNRLLERQGQQALLTTLQPRYGAPPLLNQLLRRGDLSAVLTYWHYAARLESEKFHTLLTLDDVLVALGVPTPVPMLGWCFSTDAVRDEQSALPQFLAASRATKALMASDARVWTVARPWMRADDEQRFEALKAGFLAGIPGPITAKTVAATTEVASIYLKDSAAAQAVVPAIFWPPVH